LIAISASLATRAPQSMPGVNSFADTRAAEPLGFFD
jgi:hypothetical protein